MNDASHQSTEPGSLRLELGSGWKVLLVTSIAAILTGFAAWYFVLKPRTGVPRCSKDAGT